MNYAKQIIAGVMIYFTVIGQVFGQAALLPNAEQQYFDNNGKPLASGTVTYYVPGTTTKKTTWQNSTQSVNNTNPVTLDIGGKGIMYGQGSYRQVLQDNLGNVVWDQPTTAFGSSSPSGATGTDTAPVGTVLPYSGFVVPTNWQLAYGQALSRTTFAGLMAAITISAPNIGCVSTSTTLTGFTDTSLIRVGAPIEATCLPTSTTVASITNATTIVVSQAAASTLTVTATIFPWGNGDQVSTFNVPDLRGRSAVGADCMGYVAAGNACGGNLTATYYGANPGAAGQTGGTQSKNLTIANLNAFTPTGTISTVTPAGTVATSLTSSATQLQSTVNGGTAAFGTSSTIGSSGNLSGALGLTLSSTFTGTPTTPTFTGASLGSGTAHSVINPDATVNYIIKVTPNSTGAGGVVSFGGMFGDIVCASTLTCAPIGLVNTVGCTTATVSQIGCVEPDGTTITIAGGVITSTSSVASAVVIGTTTITGGSTTDILYDNGGVLGQLSPSGTGSVCMTTNCVMTTPNLGTPSAGTLTNATGLPISSGVSGLATGVATFLATPSSANLLSALTTKTGTGNAVFGTSPTLTTPVIASIVNTGTLTLPTSSDTLVGRATTDTLTNKTINGASNTLTVRAASDITGQLPIANGGTGQATQAAAITALLPTATRAGDIAYWDGTNWNHLAGNNSGTNVFSENASGVPNWIAASGSGTVTTITTGYGLSFSSGSTCTTTCTASIVLTTGSNVLGSNVALSNTGLFFDGPSVAQGTSGTWWATGSVTLQDTAGAASMICKLWDGTTVISSGVVSLFAANARTVMSLSGFLANPAANIKISCQDATSTSGLILFNNSGTSKDATLSVHRIQ